MYESSNTSFPTRHLAVDLSISILRLTYLLHQMGVHRDCFACGRTCQNCKDTLVKQCRTCRSEYCLPHDEDCSKTEVKVTNRAAFGNDLLTEGSAGGATHPEGEQESCSDRKKFMHGL